MKQAAFMTLRALGDGRAQPRPRLDQGLGRLRGKLMSSVMHKGDRTRFNQDASSIGIGYLHAACGHIRNRNGAGYTIANNTEAGTGSTGYDLGIRHMFYN